MPVELILRQYSQSRCLLAGEDTADGGLRVYASFRIFIARPTFVFFHLLPHDDSHAVEYQDALRTKLFRHLWPLSVHLQLFEQILHALFRKQAGKVHTLGSNAPTCHHVLS